MSLRLLFWLVELRMMLLQAHYRICVYENAKLGQLRLRRRPALFFPGLIARVEVLSI
jgi:hypothetical protein